MTYARRSTALALFLSLSCMMSLSACMDGDLSVEYVKGTSSGALVVKSPIEGAAGSCLPFLVSYLNSSGVPASMVSDTSVTLGGNSPFFIDPGCTTPFFNQPVIPAGKNSITVFSRQTRIEPLTVIATFPNGASGSSASIIRAGTAYSDGTLTFSHLGLSQATPSLTIGKPTSLTVVLKDQYGNPLQGAVPQFEIGPSPTPAIPAGILVTSITPTDFTGKSTVTLSPAQAGNYNLQVVSPTILNIPLRASFSVVTATDGVTTAPVAIATPNATEAPVSLALSTPTPSATPTATNMANRCIGPFKVSISSAQANQTPINLSYSSNAIYNFYSDSNCTTALVATGITLAAGQTSHDFYFKTNRAETATLSATIPAAPQTPTHPVTTASADYTVNPDTTVSKFSITGPSILTPGQCTKIGISTLDASGNITNGNGLTLNFSGNTYLDSSCSTAVSTATFSNQGTLPVYIKASQGSLTLNVSTVGGPSTSFFYAVSTAGNTNGLQLAPGVNHLCWTINGKVKCLGKSSSGQLGTTNPETQLDPFTVISTGATAVASGANHTCAIVQNGTQSAIQCWGQNSSGQLGNGTFTNSSSPSTVQLTASASTGLNLTGITSISAGNNHTCAIINGSLLCWGANESGQLGTGDTVNQSIPVAVPISGVTSVSAGPDYTCAIAQGLVQCWGNNNHSQTGTQTSTTRPGTTLGFSAVSVSAGQTHACAVTLNGDLKCWGNNKSGQTGASTFADNTSPQTVGLSNVSAVATGAGFTCATLTNKSVKCFGNNTYGVITSALHSGSSQLSRVASLTANSSGNFACVTGSLDAETHPENAYCWGQNNYGQLGIGSYLASNFSNIPLALISLF